MTPAPIIAFLGRLKWLDGKPLLPRIEPYRRAIFEGAFSGDYSLVLASRGKKNGKSLDLTLAALFSLLRHKHPVGGSNGYLVANDADQAGEDLDLARKLIRQNPILSDALTVRAKEIERRDGSGVLAVLAAGDVAGNAGLVYDFAGFDEIHGYRNYAVLETLSPDPSRPQALRWITSYACLVPAPGRPLHDLTVIGKKGTDTRMLFSMYSASYVTDPAFQGADLTPEERANPSMDSWPDAATYLEDQKRRLPSPRYRRLHLNESAGAEGAFYAAAKIADAVVEGRKALSHIEGVRYLAYVDMSGGSSDDAYLAIAHEDEGRGVLDLVVSQTGAPPFDPNKALAKFVGVLQAWGIARVTLDPYAGLAFRAQFETAGIVTGLPGKSASELYEELEPHLNAGKVVLLDDEVLVAQLLDLVTKGGKVTHPSGGHDDAANAACGALLMALDRSEQDADGAMPAVFMIPVRWSPVSGGDGSDPWR